MKIEQITKRTPLYVRVVYQIKRQSREESVQIYVENLCIFALPTGC